MRIFEAMEGPWEDIDKARAAGRISADFYSVYPPGIPVIVPGERITDAMLRQIPRDTFRVVKEDSV